MTSLEIILITAIFIVIIVIIVLASAMRTLQPNECGVLMVMGRPVRILSPGFNLVPPLIAKVHRIKMDNIMWVSELRKYRSKQFPEFSKNIEEFIAEAKDNYGFLAK
jgi:regulator of protease activity HflC (stomatin/prohibitin superfamily)